MLNFFRRIRYNLLSENKSAKYLKYAIGEIVLVVIGILIALSINNWNQNRINSAKEQDYLIGLKTDLERQIQLFDFSNAFLDQLIREGESILADFNALGELTAIDSINKKLTTLMYTMPYPEITTTFNELNSTGQFNLIKQKATRSEIIRYYQKSDYNKSAIDGNIENVIYSQIFPIIKSMVVINPENFGFENNNVNLLDNLRATFESNMNDSTKEFELLNAISLRIIIAKNDKLTLEDAKGNAAQLLDLITNELRLN